MVLALDAIRVDYTVEAPFGGDPVGPTATPRALDVETPDEVTSGLLLTVDGVVVPLRPDPAHPPRVRASAQTATIRVWLVADAPTGPDATIVVSNANYPDLPGQFWTDVWVDAQVDVASSDLVPEGPGGIVLAGRWQGDESARTVEIGARYHRGPLATAWHRLGGDAGQLRPLAAAAPPTLATFVTEGTVRPGELGFLAVLATGLAALSRIGAPETRARLVAGVALPAVPALFLMVAPPAAPAPVEAAAGLVATGLGAWVLWGGPPVAAVGAGLFALACAGQRPGYAAVIALFAAVASIAAPERLNTDGPGRRWPVAALAATAGIVAAVRGCAVLAGVGWTP